MMRWGILGYFSLISVLLFAQDTINKSPYTVISNHILSLQKNNFNAEQASKSFNLNNKKQARELAIHLKQIIDAKGIYIKLKSIPNNPDYKDSSSLENKYFLSDKLDNIYIQRTDGKWYYSDKTIKEIPKLYKILFPFGTNIWNKIIPAYANERFWKLYYWQWLGLLGIVLIFLFTYFLSRFLIYKITHAIAIRYISNPYKGEKLLLLIMRIGSIYLALTVLQLFIPTVFLDTSIIIPAIKALGVVRAFFMFWFVYKLIEFLMEFASKYSEKTANRIDDQLVQIVRKFSKFFLILFGAFYILYLLDVNITTLIAGISIGGLAFALAAQDTVKNFIGSIMLFLDRPFNIGDTIKCEQFEGSVLEVGIRSTRIRTLTDSIISIPNGRLADMTIDNKGFRTYKKYKKELAVSNDTPLYVVELYIQSLKELLAVFPNIKPFSVDVFLADITDAGKIISVSFTYTIFSNRDEHAQREAILIEILRLTDLLQLSLFENHNEKDRKVKSENTFLNKEVYQSQIKELIQTAKNKQTEPPTGS